MGPWGWPFGKLWTGFSLWTPGSASGPRPEGNLKARAGGVALSAAPRAQRLAWASRGERVVYSLPKPGPVGQTALSLTPLEFLDQLAALVPPPRRHRHRYHGALAPYAPFHASVTARAGPPWRDASLSRDTDRASPRPRRPEFSSLRERLPSGYTQTRVRPQGARLRITLKPRQPPRTRPAPAQTPSSRPRADHPPRLIQQHCCKTALNFLFFILRTTGIGIICRT